MNAIKNVTKNIIFITIPCCLLLFILCEVFFRIIIPAAEFPNAHYDKNDKMLKWLSPRNARGTYTVGLLAKHRVPWRINNFGWNSDIDYFTERTAKQLIAVIGDSYIEAFQVAPEDSITAKLRKKIEKNYDVYSFGVSGASLAQYLQISKYVNKYFDPNIIVFNIIHNDFHESLCSVRYKLGMSCLVKTSSGLVETQIMPYKPNKLKRIIRKSSFIRYLYVNAQINRVYSIIADKIQGDEKTYNANIDIDFVSNRRTQIIEVIDYVFGSLKKNNTDKELVFMIDAPRHDIYFNSVKNSNITWLNQLLSLKCNQYGFFFIDLTDRFVQLYELNNKRFEFPDDFHWNEYAHQAAADVLHQNLSNFGIIEFD